MQNMQELLTTCLKSYFRYFLLRLQFISDESSSCRVHIRLGPDQLAWPDHDIAGDAGDGLRDRLVARARYTVYKDHR